LRWPWRSATGGLRPRSSHPAGTLARAELAWGQPWHARAQQRGLRRAATAMAAHDAGGARRWRLWDNRGAALEEACRPAVVARSHRQGAAAAEGGGRWWLGFSTVGPHGLLFGLLLGYCCLRKKSSRRYIGFLVLCCHSISWIYIRIIHHIYEMFCKE
jgi:hypothetical protein